MCIPALCTGVRPSSSKIYVLKLNNETVPTSKTDAYQMSDANRAVRRTDFSKDFHVYGMEWTEDYIYTYLDKPSFQTMFWKFDKKKTMWERGWFANRAEKSSMLADPWSSTGRKNTPFDQPFCSLGDR
jgi:beta-glucanase (GH16 family)